MIMTAAVRYYSRSGNTKKVAEAIADALGIEAVSVDQPGAEITEKTDVLFVGGALYAYGLDKHLKEYLEKIDPSKIEKAAVFSTSWISKHSLDLIKKALSDKGIKVEDETFYAKSNAVEKRLEDAKAFAERVI